MSVPAYPDYQSSDELWLGAIPKNWSLEPLRGQFYELKHKNVGALDQNYLSLVAGRGVMPYAEKGEMGNKKPDDLEKCKLVKTGNFVINSMNFGIGAFGVSTHDGVCSPVYVVLEPTEPRSLRYLRWIFDNPGFREVAQSFGNGILAHRAAIGWDDLKLMKIGVPPIEEQQAIAAFLDREAAKIDALVAEQERLIALLKEKRQAVISHAVTKGLDPDAPMKDSGIEWLGEIPAHWERLQLGRLCSQVSDGPHFSPPYQDEGFLFISARNIRVDGWSFDDAKFISEELFEEFSRRVVPGRGDVLYTKGGTTGVARVVDFDTPFQVWVHVAVLKILKDRAVPEYVAHALNSVGGYEQSQLHTRGATNKDLGLTRMIKIWLALPPLDEQASLVNWLEDHLAPIDDAMRSTGSSIELLEERRAALISAAVTGKIDVRGLVEQHELEAV